MITGGLGFIGSNLPRWLVELGAQVTLVDSLIPEYGGKRQFGWRNIFYARKNVTKNRPRKEEIPDGVLNQIRDQNSLDCELYTFALRMFAKSVASYGKDFDRDVKIFRMQNRIYQAIHTLLRHMR